VDPAAVIESPPPAAAGRVTIGRLTGANRAMLALVTLGLAIVYGPTVAWLIDRWTMSVWHNAHGMLIPLLVAYFAFDNLKRRPDLPVRGSAWGFLFFIPAIALHVLDTGIHTQLLSAASIVLALPGLSLLFLGIERTKAIAFPLAFLVFMLPIPLVFTERIHLALRHIATVASGHVSNAVGIPVYWEGTTIHLAHQTLFVGDACSGFSTLYAACAMAALTAYAAVGWKRRSLVLLSAVPLAIAANVVRVVLLVAVVHWQGIDVLSTWIHPASGMLTFALALPIIFWLGSGGPRTQETA
jgi:exosortase